MRAKINRELNGNRIQGFDELVEALKTADHAAVRLFDVVLPTRYFIVFTDPAVSQILGVLENASGHVYQYCLEHEGSGPGAH